MPKTKTFKKKSVLTKQPSKSVWTKLGIFARRPLGLLAIFVILFSGIGGFMVYHGSASTTYLSQYGCNIRGRVWVGGTGNPCANKCIPAGYTTVYDYSSKQSYQYWGQSAGSLVYASPYNYCSAAVTKASALPYDNCWNGLNRVWVSGTGCARDWRRIKFGLPAKQCRYTTYFYQAAPTGSYDYCSVKQFPN